MNSNETIICEEETPILIVDDNPQYTMVLKKILSAAFGYSNITSVECVDEAFSLVQDKPEHFRLLFVDYNFPDGARGGELLQRLQLGNLLKDKVAFLITSEPTVDNMKEAMAAGAMGVVAKPFDRSDLEKQISKAKRCLFVDSVDSF